LPEVRNAEVDIVENIGNEAGGNFKGCSGGARGVGRRKLLPRRFRHGRNYRCCGRFDGELDDDLGLAAIVKQEIVLLQIGDGVAGAVADYNRNEDQIYPTAEGSGGIVGGDFSLRTGGNYLGTKGWRLGEG